MEGTCDTEKVFLNSTSSKVNTEQDFCFVMQVQTFLLTGSRLLALIYIGQEH